MRIDKYIFQSHQNVVVAGVQDGIQEVPYLEKHKHKSTTETSTQKGSDDHQGSVSTRNGHFAGAPEACGTQ